MWESNALTERPEVLALLDSHQHQASHGGAMDSTLNPEIRCSIICDVNHSSCSLSL